MYKLEVCVDNLQSAVNALAGGAHRIELCAALSEGGVTPSYGLIEAAKHVGLPKVHVLIRPRGGNFVYSDAEIDCMLHDIKKCKKCGVDGVVIGALTREGDIDLKVCQQLIDAAQGMSITFHRAFDRCNNPYLALEQIISMGCSRLLTSGQAHTALQGAQTIKELVDLSHDRIIVMPGAGVNRDNAASILSTTGATEIHGSLSVNTHQGRLTNVDEVRALIKIIKEL